MYIFAIRNKGWALHLHKPEFPSPKAAWSIFGVNGPSRSTEEDFLISSMYFRYLVIIYPWKRAWPLCQVLLKLALWFWKRR